MPRKAGVPEWRRLYKQLTQDASGEYVVSHPGVESVKAAAAKFEVATERKLPHSYKAFAKVFGPGEFGGYYWIYIPGDVEYRFDLERCHKRMHDFFAKPPAVDEQYELRKRLLFFAETIGGENIGWDPVDVTDSRTAEYRIYYVTRLGKAKAVADSFSEFITDICLKNRLHLLFGWKNQEPPDWPPQTFEPYSAKPRRKERRTTRRQ
jgi:hypothetical protein